MRQLELGTPHSAVDANGREAPTHPMEHATWSKQGCVCGARDTRDGVLIVGALSEPVREQRERHAGWIVLVEDPVNGCYERVVGV